jgi:glycosyltransferase involved in cell wall biosynthesis
MKILFLTENFPPETNAAATRVFERACYWAKWGHEVTVITCAPNFPEGKVYDGWRNDWYQTGEMAGIRVVRVKTYIAANRGTLRRMADFISFFFTGSAAGICQERHDVVVATSPQFFSAVAGWFIGLVRRTPFVFELGDIWPKSITAVGAMKKSLLLQLFEKLELFLYRQSACVIALTRSFKRDLISRHIPAEKIAVVINGVDLPRYAPRDRDAEMAAEWNLGDKFVIGYVGTHGMAHALSNVVAAAEVLKARGEDRIVFMLAGAGAERDMLIERAKASGVFDAQMRFLPMQPKEAMPRVWSLCDVALVHLKDSPTFAEVIPSKIFEAMGMGLPLLIAAPEGEATAIVRDDNAGLVVEAEQPEALADAAVKLLEDEALRRKLAEDSHAAAASHSREAQAQQFIDVLDEVVVGRGATAGQGHPA